MRQTSIALAAVVSLTLFDIAMATATSTVFDEPKAANNCFRQAAPGGVAGAGEVDEIRILTKDEAETFRPYHQFGCADNPTATVYV